MEVLAAIFVAVIVCLQAKKIACLAVKDQIAFKRHIENVICDNSC